MTIKKKFSNKYLLFLFRIFLGLIFVYSGILKIIDAESFSNSVSNYKLLPELLVNFSAIILPWIELTAGLLLLFGISVKESSFIISTLLIFFIVAIIINLFRGLDIDCGCFGTQNVERIGLSKLIENSILLLMSIILIIFDSTFLTLQKK